MWKRMPPFREKETLPAVLDKFVLCPESLCKCAFMLGKVGHGKPQKTKQDSSWAKSFKIGEAGAMVLNAISWAGWTFCTE